MAHRGPTAVSLPQLVADQESYNGREIQTQGTVREFRDPDGTVYYVIEDNRPNRVELEPANAASPYVGQRILVAGQFHFNDRRGRSLTVERLAVLGREA